MNRSEDIPRLIQQANHWSQACEEFGKPQLAFHLRMTVDRLGIMNHRITRAATIVDEILAGPKGSLPTAADEHDWRLTQILRLKEALE